MLIFHAKYIYNKKKKFIKSIIRYLYLVHFVDLKWYIKSLIIINKKTHLFNYLNPDSFINIIFIKKSFYLSNIKALLKKEFNIGLVLSFYFDDFLAKIKILIVSSKVMFFAKLSNIINFLIKWKSQPCWDSNPESSEPESDALPLSHRVMPQFLFNYNLYF